MCINTWENFSGDTKTLRKNQMKMPKILIVKIMVRDDFYRLISALGTAEKKSST